MVPATMDPQTGQAPTKLTLRGGSRTKPGSLLKGQIPHRLMYARSGGSGGTAGGEREQASISREP